MVHGAALLSFAGAIVLGIGFWQNSGSLALFGAVAAAVGALIASLQNIKATHDINSKNLQIIDLQRHVIDRLIGGESYCSLTLIPGQNNTGAWQQFLCVLSPRPNPIYNVRIMYTTTALALAHGERYADALLRHVRSGASFSAVGTAPYHKFKTYDAILPSGYQKLDRSPIEIQKLPFVIDARFTARNGEWHQSIIMEIGNDGNFAEADFIVRGSELLRNHVTPNFPYKDRIFVQTVKGEEKAWSNIPFCCKRN